MKRKNRFYIFISSLVLLLFLYLVFNYSYQNHLFQPVQNITELNTVSVSTKGNIEMSDGNYKKSSTPISSSLENVGSEMIDVTPTMNKDQQKEYLSEIYGNEVCKFPCWWNITPGVSEWEEIQTNQFLNKLFLSSDNIKDAVVHYGNIPSFDPQLGISTFILEKDNQVEEVSLYGSGFWGTPSYDEFRDILKLYFPFQILKTYGQPDRIWIYVYDYRGFAAEYTSYYLWFVYERSNFYVKYEGLTENTYDIYHICPKQIITDIQISIQSPDQDLQLDKDIYGNDDKEAKYKMPLMEVTDTTIEQFYKSMTDPKNEGCFETNYENWKSDEWR